MAFITVFSTLKNWQFICWQTIYFYSTTHPVNMIIEIDDTKTIKDIQERFNFFFPNLKIEFFQHPHHLYEGSANNESYPSNKTIAEIRTNHAHGDIEIHSKEKTGVLEQEFRKKFGLHVQVFRLHGKEWVQTVDTDQLSLEAQNARSSS